MVPQLIGAGIGAIVPLIAEIARSKPDPETAKQAILAKRQEMIDMAVGAGDSMQRAEHDVDAKIAQEIAAAEEAGSFNMPVGEMVMGAGLGALAPMAFGKIGGLMGGAKAAQTAAAAPSTAAVASSPVSMGSPFPAAMGGMPLTLGRTVAPKRANNVDVGAMLGGGPFPG